MLNTSVNVVADYSGFTTKLRISEWAKINKIDPLNMGPKNYQRCLYDLGMGGHFYSLESNPDGTLKYQ